MVVMGCPTGPLGGPAGTGGVSSGIEGDVRKWHMARAARRLGRPSPLGINGNYREIVITIPQNTQTKFAKYGLFALVTICLTGLALQWEQVKFEGSAKTPFAHFEGKLEATKQSDRAE